MEGGAPRRTLRQGALAIAAAAIFGLGYTGARLAERLRSDGWQVTGTGGGSPLRFDNADAVRASLAVADHVVSTVPPDDVGDPVLANYGKHLDGKTLIYLSSTGVYGDADGAWVDESAAILGRRPLRNAADAEWLARGARVLRLPGIYGPGRSPLDRVVNGQAHRVDLSGQVFSRIHVDDIVSGVLAAFAGPAGAYNLADDHPCSQNTVVEAAAEMLGLDPPPFVALDQLSAMGRSFYAENRRVANGRAKRLLGWTPRYPDFASGLRALRAINNPAIATTPPAAASQLQR